jgi:hypothetical protein
VVLSYHQPRIGFRNVRILPRHIEDDAFGFQDGFDKKKRGRLSPPGIREFDKLHIFRLGLGRKLENELSATVVADVDAFDILGSAARAKHLVS